MLLELLTLPQNKKTDIEVITLRTDIVIRFTTYLADVIIIVIRFITYLADVLKNVLIIN